MMVYIRDNLKKVKLDRLIVEDPEEAEEEAKCIAAALANANLKK